MVWALVLVVVVCTPAYGWELNIAFTGDLHASYGRIEALAPLLADADLILDAGDAWEDTWLQTGARAARRTVDLMNTIGYTTMVLGNHELYMGPVVRSLIDRADFPVVVTNLRGDLPVVRWIVVESQGIGVLILGVLWDPLPWSLWPAVELGDPAEAVQQTLEEAPEHDVLIILGHLTLAHARRVAAAAPECRLFITGHEHLWLEEPVWEGTVPIVQAGHRGGAVGRVHLTPEAAEYELVPVDDVVPLGYTGLLTVLAALLLLLWP